MFNSFHLNSLFAKTSIHYFEIDSTNGFYTFQNSRLYHIDDDDQKTEILVVDDAIYPTLYYNPLGGVIMRYNNNVIWCDSGRKENIVNPPGAILVNPMGDMLYSYKGVHLMNKLGLSTLYVPNDVLIEYKIEDNFELLLDSEGNTVIYTNNYKSKFLLINNNLTRAESEVINELNQVCNLDLLSNGFSLMLLENRKELYLLNNNRRYKVDLKDCVMIYWVLSNRKDRFILLFQSLNGNKLIHFRYQTWSPKTHLNFGSEIKNTIGAFIRVIRIKNWLPKEIVNLICGYIATY